MAKVDGEKLKQRFEKARADYQAHLKLERAKRKKERTRDDTERKIVAGEFVLSLIESGEYDRGRFMARLDTYLTDNRRRSLFDLPPRSETTETVSLTAENPPVDGTSVAS